MKVLSVFGTRPEAIKMAPIIKKLQSCTEVESLVCSTGQHTQLITQVLDIFSLKADIELKVMTPNQKLNDLTIRIIARIDEVLEKTRPDCVLVHGDTTSAMAASLAAFHRGIKVGHVEAGLRTYDLTKPWPEEMNRRLIDIASEIHFAPTKSNAENLYQENLGGTIVVTGNTVIDSLFRTIDYIDADVEINKLLNNRFSFLDPSRRLILATAHRRESYGKGIESICWALSRIADRRDVQIVLPVHPNPNVFPIVHGLIGEKPRIHLVEPQDYLSFVYLMQRADIILSDSGGVQEEAPSLGKPLLVTRERSERPEAIEAGAAKLVGLEYSRIILEVEKLLDDYTYRKSFSGIMNPYGDGQASERIVGTILGRNIEPFFPMQQSQLTKQKHHH